MEKKLIRSAYNTRIPCISRVRTAKMIYENIEIGKICEETNDAGEFDWVIKPNWDNLKKVTPIQIAGIDMDLHLDEYIRTVLPAFVTERTLPDKRENLAEELEKLGMHHNDRFEFMCRTHGLCGVNTITVEFESDVIL